jgi:hypothetical protein
MRTPLPVAVVAGPPITRHERDRYALDLVAAGTDDLDALNVGARAFLGPRRLDRDDGDPFEFEVSFGPQNVAHLGHRRKKATVERALGLLGPRGAPGPRSVITTAGQFNIESARHPNVHATADSGSLRTQ